jgi:hypothetical protein
MANGKPTDVGRTSGGGSLGHEQPRSVEAETNTRNNTGGRPDDAAMPTGSEDDPVMPADDATLKTRI